MRCFSRMGRTCTKDQKGGLRLGKSANKGWRTTKGCALTGPLATRPNPSHIQIVLQFLTNKIWVCVNMWAQYGGQHL